MFELKRLSIDDGFDIYDLLQDIPQDENGFYNSGHGITKEEFKNWLIKKHNDSIQEGLVDGWKVLSTTFFLYYNKTPVGMANLRHFLTPALLSAGGHIGYAISPKYRFRGFGKELLKLTLIEAKKLNIDKVLITTNISNFASQKVALANGGVITKKTDERVYIWIDN